MIHEFSPGFTFGSFTAPGFGAQSNQDTVCVEECRRYDDAGVIERLFAVCLCDGHGVGTRLADFVSDKLIESVAE